jgi:hypothetical protein
MRASPSADLRQRIPAGAVLATLALAAACATPRTPALSDTGTPAPPGGLRVELHFGAEADLDLYVTDPLRETVYFANTPTRRGGVLERDLRCDAPAPRTEAVVFEVAPAGRYRVGVDFPRRCGGTLARSVPYLLVVRADGLRREQRAQIEFGRFELRALELELPSPSMGPRP